MELLKELSDKDLGLDEASQEIRYEVRKAARAIVANQQGKIALLYVSKNNYHKLPGGGIEAGEDIRSALNREVMEEVGVEIKVLGEVGVIIEYRHNFEAIQISYCYYAETIGEANQPAFTDTEKAGGFQLKWVDFSEVIPMLENDEPDNYVGKFIQKRDLEFLLKYRR